MATVELTNITNEALDFLVSAPSPEQIIAFNASDRAQERLRTLLDINRNGTHSAEEKTELDEMNRVNHFFYPDQRPRHEGTQRASSTYCNKSVSIDCDFS